MNDPIKFDEVNVEYASKARFLHLTSFVGEESFRSQKKLLDILPEDVKISFDPGALYARKGLARLEPIIKRTYVLMPNSAELELLTGETDYCKGADYPDRKGRQE